MPTPTRVLPRVTMLDEERHEGREGKGSEGMGGCEREERERERDREMEYAEM